jgi:outer membrane protein assembly factor BamA
MAGQAKPVEAKHPLGVCTQAPVEQASLINLAERHVYTIRRIEIMGNMYVRDREIRRKMGKSFAEGNIFTGKALYQAIKNLSRMRTLRPTTLRDVKLILDQPRKDVDFILCVKERR